MADFSSVPDFTIEEQPEFDTLISDYELGVEQERSKRTYPLRSWKLQFLDRTQAETDVIRNFFISKKGAFTHFTWINPIDNVEYYVRFQSNSLNIQFKAYDVYDIECVFQEVFYFSTTSSTSTTSTSTTSTSTTSTSTTSTSTSTTTSSTTSTSTTTTTV